MSCRPQRRIISTSAAFFALVGGGENRSSSETMADHQPDDLDQLLDSKFQNFLCIVLYNISSFPFILKQCFLSFPGALDDFQSLNLNSSVQRSLFFLSPYPYPLSFRACPGFWISNSILHVEVGKE